MRKIALAIVVAFALPVMAHAQKKALTQADWDKWKSINAPALSNDGKWAVYTLIPQVGDGDLVIRSTTGATEYRVPRGFLGRRTTFRAGCVVRRAAVQKRRDRRSNCYAGADHGR
jgi:hypothetical protein